VLKRCIGASLATLALAMSACGGGGSSGSGAAATVNGHDISLAAYNQAFYQKRVETADAQGYDPCSVKDLAPACALLKRQALQSLIDRELVREYAARHQLSVSQAEFAAEWAVVLKQRFDDRQDVLSAYARRMHTTEAQIKQGVTDDLLQEKVVYDVTRSMSLITPAVRLGIIRAGSRKEMRQILLQMKRRPGFFHEAYALSLKPTSPCSQSQTPCGDLGWTPTAFIPPNEKTLTTDPPGSLVGPYGLGQEIDVYFIEFRNPRYRMTSRQAFAMRSEVLFPRWLKQRERAAKVTKHVEV
jgi:hypothetical protein